MQPSESSFPEADDQVVGKLSGGKWITTWSLDLNINESALR